MRLRISNQNSELVLSDQGKGLFCLGRAQLQTTVQVSGGATSQSPGRQSGYSVYRVWCDQPVLFAIELHNNLNIGILSVTQVTSGVWDAMIYCGGGGVDGYGFDNTQYEPNVWAYTFPTDLTYPNMGYIKAADGNVSYDFSKPNLLFPIHRGVCDSPGQNLYIPSIERPVIIGTPTRFLFGDNSTGSVNRWAFNHTRYMWHRTDNRLTEAPTTRQRYEYSSDTPISLSGSAESPTPFFIIDGALLP